MDVIYRLFGTRRSRSRWYGDVTNNRQERKKDSQTNERKEDPPPPSKSDWTCDNQPKYSIKESPKDAWESCNDIIDEYDEDLCKQLKEEISFLLVVAGLFLAVVTAFTVESYKWLQEDKEDKMADLLVEVVRLLNNTSAQGSARLPEPFIPEKHNIVVNQIWFLSMILSLVAVVFGTFCLQWISAFRQNNATNKSVSPPRALALRQLCFDGLVGWGVLQGPAILLLIVQASIILFTIGLVFFLSSISRMAAYPTIIVAGASGTLLYLANLMPFLQPLLGVVVPATHAVPQCPYKSPTSWLLHGTCVLLNSPWIILFRHFVGWRSGDTIAQRISFWCNYIYGPPTDYLWQRYNELCESIRKRWGPQHGSGTYSHYLVRGIASAMDILVSKPNAVEIIPGCTHILRSEFRNIETWEKLFHTKLSRAEKALLRGHISLEDKDAGNSTISAVRIEKLKKDFLNAHIFQHLVEHSQKLRRILHQHRIELYIRIKNSSREIVPRLPHSLPQQDTPTDDDDDDDGGTIGSSIVCPIGEGQDIQEIQEMSQELKIQFLSCAMHLIGTRQFLDDDVRIAAWVVASERRTQASPSTGPRDRPPPATREDSIPGPSDQDRPPPATREDSMLGPSEVPTKKDKGVSTIGVGARSVVGIGLASSNAQDRNNDGVDDDSKLRELCQEVRGKLDQLSSADFPPNVIAEIRRIVGLDPEHTKPQPLGIDSV